MSDYPENLLLQIIGEMFVHNRLLSEQLKALTGREENEDENTTVDQPTHEGPTGQGSSDSS
jgi:hypothetical protein